LLPSKHFADRGWLLLAANGWRCAARGAAAAAAAAAAARRARGYGSLPLDRWLWDSVNE